MVDEFEDEEDETGEVADFCCCGCLLLIEELFEMFGGW